MELVISEGCFGPTVNINGESLFKGEYDQRSDSDVDKLQQILLDEISKIKSNLDMYDWAQIAQILASRGNFQYNESESNDGDSCEQCGNWNYCSSYTKIEDTDEGVNN